MWHRSFISRIWIKTIPKVLLFLVNFCKLQHCRRRTPRSQLATQTGTSCLHQPPPSTRGTQALPTSATLPSLRWSWVVMMDKRCRFECTSLFYVIPHLLLGYDSGSSWEKAHQVITWSLRFDMIHSNFSCVDQTHFWSFQFGIRGIIPKTDDFDTIYAFFVAGCLHLYAFGGSIKSCIDCPKTEINLRTIFCHFQVCLCSPQLGRQCHHRSHFTCRIHPKVLSTKDHLIDTGGPKISCYSLHNNVDTQSTIYNT